MLIAEDFIKRQVVQGEKSKEFSHDLIHSSPDDACQSDFFLP